MTGWLSTPGWTFPRLFRRPHGNLRPADILHLTTLVNQLLRPCKVGTTLALAFTRTKYTSLKTLAVLLQTLRFLAPAPHAVVALSWVVGHHIQSWLERLRVLGTSLLHGLVSHVLMLGVIAAVRAVATIAEQFRRKAFTVELEATRLLAVTGVSLGRNHCLGLFLVFLLQVCT